MIGRALTSALKQTYDNIEIIVADDASTDNTQEVVQQFADRDDRIRYIRQNERMGIAPTWKKAFFEYATGDLITVLNDDDEFIDNDFIVKAVALFEKYENDHVVCVFSSVMYKNYYEKLDFYEDDLSYSRAFPEIIDGEELFYGDAFIHTDNGTIYKKEALKDLELFNHDIFTLDVEMMYKLMSQGSFAYIDTPTYLHHFDQNCLSRANSKKFTQAMQSVKWIEIVYDFYSNRFGESAELAAWFEKRAAFAWKSLLYRVEFDYEDFVYSVLQKLPRNREIYIYGTGKGAKFLFDALRDKQPNVQIAGFIDDLKSGEFCGLLVVKPEDADMKSVLVIAINDYAVAHKIVCRCLELGFLRENIFDIVSSNY